MRALILGLVLCGAGACQTAPSEGPRVVRSHCQGDHERPSWPDVYKIAIGGCLARRSAPEFCHELAVEAAGLAGCD